MGLLIILFFNHIKLHQQRIGYQSIKLIGFILMFPGICILAIVGGDTILSGQALSVLLGTIAGYILSREDESSDTAKKKQLEAEDQIKIKDKEIADLKVELAKK